jgi:integrase
MPKYYIPKNEFRIILYEEIKKYIDATDDSDFKFVLALAWLTGARIQEIVNLKRRDFQIGKNDLTIIIKALKRGKIGYPTFSFKDPFISDLIIPRVLSIEDPDSRVCLKSKRTYQRMLLKLNKKLYPNEPNKWITFHYLRHSRITFLARVLKAFPEELKSWTGHRSQAFEEYFAPRRVMRFKGKIR